MKCPFCAEEIQDAAILCRYCGAAKHNERWEAAASLPPDNRPQTQIKGRFTMRTAGALFLLSALFEFFSLTSAVPLFGGLQVGLAAITYHCLFIAIFVAMGMGLWRAEPWGYKAVLTGTVIFILDRVRYLLDDAARSAEMAEQTRGYQQILELVDLESIDKWATSVTLVIIVCWLGFAVFVHLHREYFQGRGL